MDFLQWNEKYALGIQEIDSQHQSLFLLINRLYRQMIRVSDPIEDNEILDELIKYTKVHFSFEENFFDKISFAESDKKLHKMEHLNFCAKIEEFQEKMLSGEEGLTTSMMIFLKDWLKNHILKTDMTYKIELDKISAPE
ncbi:MAG: bacteriohemerythrin [Bacteriovorax sp.]|nr:bacteriohemerythrin [Bacteriovorax sp.]